MHPAGASGFEVALDADGGGVTYRMEDCGPGDVEGVFYLHVYPVDARDLPEERRSVGFDNLDFRFHDYGVARGGLCIAERALPDYGVRAVRTGRYDDRSGEMAWERTLGLAGSSGFAASLDEDAGKAVWRADDCAAADVGHRFLFRVYPVDPADLPPGRRAAGFDDLDFDFSDYGVLRGASCIAERPLPGYRIETAWTGQYDIETGRVKWERRLGLAGSSGFAASLDEDAGKAIWRADDCGAADMGHRFLFRVYPVDPADLPPGGGRRGSTISISISPITASCAELRASPSGPFPATASRPSGPASTNARPASRCGTDGFAPMAAAAVETAARMAI